MYTEELPKTHRPYQAHGASLRVWSCRDEEICIHGPAGTGKTRGLLEKVLYVAYKYPGCRILLVRKTRESLSESVLVTFEEKVVPADSGILDGPQRNLRQYYKVGESRIVVGGMDKSTKVMSSEYDLIICFEATELTEEDYENLTTRLRNGMMPYQQIICDCNPGPPSHWLKRRMDAGKMTSFASRHEDNPFLFDHKLKEWKPEGKRYLAKLGKLSGVRRLRLLDGKWVAAEGMVYDNYDPDVHLIPRIYIPPTWKRIRSIDFGFKNPFVCQWWAIDPDGIMYLYREIYMTNRIVSNHAETIKKYSQGEKYWATVCDHDLEDRMTLENSGIPSIRAYKDISRGVQAVRKRFEVQANGKARIYILRNSLVEEDEELEAARLPTNTAAEIESYVWDKKKNKPLNEEEPVDENNHGQDAKRYAVAFVDNLAGMMVKVQMAKTVIVKG